MDLIGNVHEWTSTKAAPYPGSNAETKDQYKDNSHIFRGGGAF
jgi:formylglycine-generating enzyme required for sulfatase activity